MTAHTSLNAQKFRHHTHIAMQGSECFSKTQMRHVFADQLRHRPCLRKVARLLERLAVQLLGQPRLVQRKSSRIRDAEWHWLSILIHGLNVELGRVDKPLLRSHQIIFTKVYGLSTIKATPRSCSSSSRRMRATTRGTRASLSALFRRACSSSCCRIAARRSCARDLPS